MLYENNLLMQGCAIVSLIVMIIIFIATLIPALEFDLDVEAPNTVRAVMAIIIIGLMRGAF